MDRARMRHFIGHTICDYGNSRVARKLLRRQEDYKFDPTFHLRDFIYCDKNSSAGTYMIIGRSAM